MRKLISTADLRVGMFVEAQTRTEVRDGGPQHFLEAINALGVGASGRRARLTGRMHIKIDQDGGLLLTSEGQIRSFRETGLSLVTIDTDKGSDLPPGVAPASDPTRRPPPPGRLVHYDEEIERAREIREETSSTLRESLEAVAAGQTLDTERLRQAGTVIAESLLRNVDAMVSLTRLKKHDPYTAVHCMNVCTLVTAMALHDGVPPAELPQITAAALLHDVGKSRVPLAILNKPGRFEPHELQEMRKHATYSGDIMQELGGFSADTVAIATQHHEMMDGSGYPLGLRGEQVHVYARLTAVADVYDALTAKRVYKPAMPMYQAMRRIVQNEGTEFDGHAVELFTTALGVYPVGSLVELSTRELALVMEPNPVDPHKPTVGIFTLSGRRPRSAPLLANLALRSEAEGREIKHVLDPEREGVDVERVMQDVAERGEHGERRRR